MASPETKNSPAETASLHEASKSEVDNLRNGIGQAVDIGKINEFKQGLERLPLFFTNIKDCVEAGATAGLEGREKQIRQDLWGIKKVLEWAKWGCEKWPSEAAHARAARIDLLLAAIEGMTNPVEFAKTIKLDSNDKGLTISLTTDPNAKVELGQDGLKAPEALNLPKIRNFDDLMLFADKLKGDVKGDLDLPLVQTEMNKILKSVVPGNLEVKDLENYADKLSGLADSLPEPLKATGKETLNAIAEKALQQGVPLAGKSLDFVKKNLPNGVDPKALEKLAQEGVTKGGADMLVKLVNGALQVVPREMPTLKSVDLSKGVSKEDFSNMVRQMKAGGEVGQFMAVVLEMFGKFFGYGVQDAPAAAVAQEKEAGKNRAARLPADQVKKIADAKDPSEALGKTPLDKVDPKAFGDNAEAKAFAQHMNSQRDFLGTKAFNAYVCETLDVHEDQSGNIIFDDLWNRRAKFMNHASCVEAEKPAVTDSKETDKKTEVAKEEVTRKLESAKQEAGQIIEGVVTYLKQGAVKGKLGSGLESMKTQVAQAKTPEEIFKVVFEGIQKAKNDVAANTGGWTGLSQEAGTALTKFLNDKLADAQKLSAQLTSAPQTVAATVPKQDDSHDRRKLNIKEYHEVLDVGFNVQLDGMIGSIDTWMALHVHIPDTAHKDMIKQALADKFTLAKEGYMNGKIDDKDLNAFSEGLERAAKEFLRHDASGANIIANFQKSLPQDVQAGIALGKTPSQPDVASTEKPANSWRYVDNGYYRAGL